jgi:hypothetical protein
MKQKKKAKELTHEDLVNELVKAKVKFEIKLKKLRKQCVHEYKRRSDYQGAYYICTKCHELKEV